MDQTTLQILSSIVSNQLFPIVACIFMYKQQLAMQGALVDLTATLKTIDSRIERLESGQAKNIVDK